MSDAAAAAAQPPGATGEAQAPGPGEAGPAYQAVAQSAAIAVQDATDALRHATTIAAAAAGTALAQFLASGDPRYLAALGPAREMVDKAIADFAAIGAASAQLLSVFPAGDEPTPGGDEGRQ